MRSVVVDYARSRLPRKRGGDLKRVAEIPEDVEGPLRLDEDMPVSYTHLDVYKRQLQDMPHLTAEEAVLTGFFASFMLPPDQEISDDMRERARHALARVGALALAGRQVTEISTGEMRRVLIARALVHGPQALLLDEPTSGLDLVAQQNFLALLDELARQGVTLVLVTHHTEEIIAGIDRVILLRDGKVFADGNRADTLTSANLSAVFGGAVQVLSLIHI